MVRLVESLEPTQKSNLFVFGVSYGTVAATLLTHKLESKGIPVKAAILEGVVGIENNAKLASSQVEAAMIRISDRLHSEFPAIKDLIDGKSNPFGLKQEIVDNFIFAGLYYDYRAVGKMLTRAVELSRKSPPLDSAEANELKKILADVEEKGKVGASGLVESDYGSSRFFKIVRCGNIGAQAKGIDWCKDKPRLKGYDSKDYQLKSALYYFQSKVDLATVYEGAKYHFDNQRAAAFKIFTSSDRFGHGALHYYKQQRPCSEALFTAIYQLKRDFSDIVNPDGSCISEERLRDRAAKVKSNNSSTPVVPENFTNTESEPLPRASEK